MKRKTLSSDEDFEKELADLKASPYVALARREQRLKYLQIPSKTKALHPAFSLQAWQGIGGTWIHH